jgi:hypothetical protein
MVEQLTTWKNRRKFSDSFDCYFNLKLVEPQIWRDLYETQGLSASQIAAKFKAPKQSILDALRRSGVQMRRGSGHSTRVENYRAFNPPFGFKALAGKLKMHPKEKEICRMIVYFRRDKQLSCLEIARELNRLALPTRKGGKSQWHAPTVRSIYKRWNKLL